MFSPCNSIEKNIVKITSNKTTCFQLFYDFVFEEKLPILWILGKKENLIKSSKNMF